MKRCNVCLLEKAISEFGRNSKQPDGLSPRCRECWKAYERAWRERNKDRLQQQARWKTYYTPERVRTISLKKRYGLSLEDYDRRLAEQHGACKICGATGKLVVDHKHDASQRVRGLLCSSCNSGLGNFGDDVPTMLAAIAYIHLQGGYDTTRHTVEITVQ